MFLSQVPNLACAEWRSKHGFFPAHGWLSEGNGWLVSGDQQLCPGTKPQRFKISNPQARPKVIKGPQRCERSSQCPQSRFEWPASAQPLTTSNSRQELRRRRTLSDVGVNDVVSQHQRLKLIQNFLNPSHWDSVPPRECRRLLSTWGWLGSEDWWQIGLGVLHKGSGHVDEG